MPKRNEGDRKVADAFHAVVREEIARRRGKPDRLSGRKVSLTISPNNPNLVADASARRKLPSLAAVLQYGDALGVEPHELVYRVQARLRSASPTPAIYGED